MFHQILLHLQAINNKQTKITVFYNQLSLVSLVILTKKQLLEMNYIYRHMNKG